MINFPRGFWSDFFSEVFGPIFARLTESNTSFGSGWLEVLTDVGQYVFLGLK
jgi:hypothetical protein